MGYRNKTYVIFDGSKDMWAYGYMLGWCTKDHIAFDFHDAHEIREIKTATDVTYIKRVLRERFASTKQAIVVIGEETKSHHRFVQWEIETCLELGIPIVAVNLNGERKLDPILCPPILKGTRTVHVAFRAKIIQHALDNFCDGFDSYKDSSDYFYKDEVYKGLGL